MKTHASFGLAVLMVAVLALAVPNLALAAGTDTNYGTTITNSVTIQYGSGPSTITTSTSVNFVVDRILDWTIAPSTAATVGVFPSSAGNAIAFSVQNATNGTIDVFFTLNNLAQLPSSVGLFEDTNSNAGYDAGVDAALPTSGSGWYLDEVSEDAAPTVFIVVDVAAAATTADLYSYEISSVPRAGLAAGSLGAVLASDNSTADISSVVQNVYNDGAGYSDSARDFVYTAYAAFQVVNAALTATKTAVVTDDPVNGATNPKAIPGATIHYTITITNTGTAAATGVSVSDAIPADTSYVATSLSVTGGGGGVVTDDTGDPLTVTGAVIAGGAAMTVEFDVTID